MLQRFLGKPLTAVHPSQHLNSQHCLIPCPCLALAPLPRIPDIATAPCAGITTYMYLGLLFISFTVCADPGRHSQHLASQPACHMGPQTTVSCIPPYVTATATSVPGYIRAPAHLITLQYTEILTLDLNTLTCSSHASMGLQLTLHPHGLALQPTATATPHPTQHRPVQQGAPTRRLNCLHRAPQQQLPAQSPAPVHTCGSCHAANRTPPAPAVLLTCAVRGKCDTQPLTTEPLPTRRHVATAGRAGSCYTPCWRRPVRPDH